MFLLIIISGQMVINIEDINDNAPEFIYSDAVFGECSSQNKHISRIVLIERKNVTNLMQHFATFASQFVTNLFSFFSCGVRKCK